MFILQYWIWSWWWVVCYRWSFTAYKSFRLLFSEFLTCSWSFVLVPLGAMTLLTDILWVNPNVDVANEKVQKLFYSEIIFHLLIIHIKQTVVIQVLVVQMQLQYYWAVESKLDHSSNYTSIPNKFGKARLT